MGRYDATGNAAAVWQGIMWRVMTAYGTTRQWGGHGKARDDSVDSDGVSGDDIEDAGDNWLPKNLRRGGEGRGSM